MLTNSVIELPNCPTCNQEQCFIRKYCSEEWKKKISMDKNAGVYGEKQLIFKENNMVFGIYFIYRGCVKVFTEWMQKKQQIIRIAFAGEMVGLRSYAEKNYRVSCATLENSILCFIEKNIFVSAIKENPELASALIQFYATQLSNLELRMKHLVFFKVKERVAEALLMLKKYFGKTVEDGILLDVKFSQRTIADIASATVEETNRTLMLFKKEKLILKNSNKKIILLNSDKLHEMISQNDFKNDEYLYPHTAVANLKPVIK